MRNFIMNLLAFKLSQDLGFSLAGSRGPGSAHTKLSKQLNAPLIEQMLTTADLQERFKVLRFKGSNPKPPFGTEARKKI